MKKLGCALVLCNFLFFLNYLQAQPTFPVNGVADERHGYYAFTNATIVKDATTTLSNAILIIKDGKIVSIGSNVKVPAGAVLLIVKANIFILLLLTFIAITAHLPLQDLKALPVFFRPSKSTRLQKVLTGGTRR